MYALHNCLLGDLVVLPDFKRFYFGFEGWVWVLIASVPDLCILFTFSRPDVGAPSMSNKHNYNRTGRTET